MTIRTTGQSRAAKSRGREGEKAVEEYLENRGIRAERRRTTGIEDCGDLACDKLVVEVKARKTLAFGPWLDELEAEVANADKRFAARGLHRGIVVAKRRGKTNPAEWFVCLPLGKMVDLLIEAGHR